MMKPGMGIDGLDGGSSIASGVEADGRDEGSGSALRPYQSFEREPHRGGEETDAVHGVRQRRVVGGVSSGQDGGDGEAESPSERHEGDEGSAAIWDGLPRSRRGDRSDDEGSVSTRLMFASDDGRR